MNSQLPTRCDQPLGSVCSGQRQPLTAQRCTFESASSLKISLLCPGKLPSNFPSSLSPCFLRSTIPIFITPSPSPQTHCHAVNLLHLSASSSHHHTSHGLHFPNKLTLTQKASLIFSSFTSLQKSLTSFRYLTSRSHFQKKKKRGGKAPNQTKLWTGIS